MKNLLSQIGKIKDLCLGCYPEKIFNKPTGHIITEISITIDSYGEEEEKAVKEFYEKLFYIQQKQSKKL